MACDESLFLGKYLLIFRNKRDKLSARIEGKAMEELNWLMNRWLLIMFRGACMLAPLFVIFWIWKPAFLQRFRIHQPAQKPTRIPQEIAATIMGLSVYLIPLYGAYVLKRDFGYSKIYLDIAEYGYIYLVFSFVLFAVIVDTWFYWAHRAMHHYPLLARFHHWHHKSYNITPFTSYSFHIGEAIIDMLSYALVLFLIPLHPVVLSFFGLFGIFYNGYIHVGYDFPASWRTGFSPLRYLYSSTQHSIHHQEYKHNYAVYFTFWDRLMKTEKRESTPAS
jgi:sterol desaturase/sphingolipid hydroxylase (fatty acid hydroxylase superfamily)